MASILNPRIVFEDPNLIVLAKPPGLLSQGEHTGDENVVDWLRTYWGRPYVGLVHRLDRNTSGLLVVAKRTKAAERLTKSLQTGELERTYLALLEGSLKAPATWRHWLLKDEATNTTRTVKAGTSGAKEAVLRVEPRLVFESPHGPLTLAHFQLETGRGHQIRAQAKAEGHPLVGDRKYGSKANFPRPALHSASLSFPHPISKEVLRFEEPLPDDMGRLLPRDTR